VKMMEMIGGFIIFSARQKIVFKSRYLCNSQKKNKKTSGVVELVARYPASKVSCMHLDSPLKVQFDELILIKRPGKETN
jgi:hypothetical protein